MESKTASQPVPFETFTEPENRFNLLEIIGRGTYGKVYSAIDKCSEKKVAVKVLDSIIDNLSEIESEYRVLMAVRGEPHFPMFHSVYMTTHVNQENQQLWFVMEFLEGTNACEILRNLRLENQRLSEEHIAFILKNITESLGLLYDNKIIYRDVRAANIIITIQGDVKIIDFGFSVIIKDIQEKVNLSIGSPYWMAPEVVACCQLTTPYNWACDVWSLGVTAIELADTLPPMDDISPSRAMFRTIRNPPPTLRKPTDWSEELNDFINECLVKNPDHRPHFMELLEHPFLSKIKFEEQRIRYELGCLSQRWKDNFTSEIPYPTVKNGYLKRIEGTPHVRMYVDDLCNLENPTWDTLIEHLEKRFLLNNIYTYVGDVLLSLNPEKDLPCYTEVKALYREKTLSDNPPHLFAVADRVFEQMLHHKISQSVILSGVSGSGKSFCIRNLVDHLSFLGKATNEGMKEKIRHLCPLLDAFGSAGTQINPDASRHVKCLSISFSQSGKISGGKISSFLLETKRVTSAPPYEGNFHVFYLLYHGLKEQGNLSHYYLDSEKDFRYVPDMNVRNTQIHHYYLLLDAFQILAFTTEEIELVWRVLAAVLLLGNIEFVEDEGQVEIKNHQTLLLVSKLLSLASDKLHSLLCKKNSDEAERSRNCFARFLYKRIFDWIIAVINSRLYFTRLVYGNKYDITIVDPPGFEDSTENTWWKLAANSSSDYIHNIILETIFCKELEEYGNESIGIPFYCGKDVNNYADFAKQCENQRALLDTLHHCTKAWKTTGNWTEELNRAKVPGHINISENGESMTLNHTYGQVSYDARDLVTGNEGNIFPGCAEVLQSSCDVEIKALSLGNVISKEQEISRSLTNAQELQLSLPLLKYGKVEPSQVIFCIRTFCPNEIKSFNCNFVLHQIKCARILELASTRQNGFSVQISFADFLNRYKFLAFDFDENVEISRENCQLLLIRLKIDGWTIGSSKVFLKYYAEEYLTHLYEIHAKKVIKVQALARRFLVQTRKQKQ